MILESGVIDFAKSASTPGYQLINSLTVEDRIEVFKNQNDKMCLNTCLSRSFIFFQNIEVLVQTGRAQSENPFMSSSTKNRKASSLEGRGSDVIWEEYYTSFEHSSLDSLNLVMLYG